jgi:hypothetical protein
VILRSPIGRREASFSIPGFAGPEEHQYGHRMSVMLYSPKPV